LAALTFHQKTQILARDLDRLLADTVIFVAELGDLSRVPAIAIMLSGRNVETALAVIRNSQIDIKRAGPRLEELRNCFRWRWRIGTRDFKQQAVGENSRSSCHCYLSFG